MLWLTTISVTNQLHDYATTDNHRSFQLINWLRDAFKTTLSSFNGLKSSSTPITTVASTTPWLSGAESSWAMATDTAATEAVAWAAATTISIWCTGDHCRLQLLADECQHGSSLQLVRFCRSYELRCGRAICLPFHLSCEANEREARSGTRQNWDATQHHTKLHQPHWPWAAGAPSNTQNAHTFSRIKAHSTHVGGSVVVPHPTH